MFRGKTGFSLFECLLYIMCSALVIMLSSCCIGMLFTKSNQYYHTMSSCIALCMAQESLAQDIYTTQEGSLVFESFCLKAKDMHNNIYMWYVKKGLFLRAYIKYSKKNFKRKISKKRASVVAEDITQFFCNIKNNNLYSFSIVSSLIDVKCFRAQRIGGIL